MDLLTELQHQIEAYLDEQIDLMELLDWASEHTQDVMDVNDPELTGLDGQVWGLTAEWSAGHRSEESVRAALRAAFHSGRARGVVAVDEIRGTLRFGGAVEVSTGVHPSTADQVRRLEHLADRRWRTGHGLRRIRPGTPRSGAALSLQLQTQHQSAAG